MTSSISAIHVAKKQLGLDEDTYRAKLVNIVGKPSTKDMTEDERQKVLTVFRNEGFRPAAPSRRADGRAKLTGKFAGKLQALWIAGWNLGIFRERDDAALVNFVKRQTGLDAVQFLRFPEDARKAIEAIKAILARDGGVDWSLSRFMPSYTQVDGYRIASAQWRILGSNDALEKFWPAAQCIAGKPSTAMLDDRDWIVVMNELGKRIRAAKAGV